MNRLSDREKLVLEAVVRNYILTSNPVSSSLIARNSHLAFSPATIRNILGKLEEKGYIYQPHPSAGRVPTALGYRIYVNEMMGRTRLPNAFKEKIAEAVKKKKDGVDSVLKEATRILAHLSSQLSVITSPHMEEGIFHHMDITPLNSERLLLIISIKSGMVKTIMLELRSTINPAELDSLKQLLNERLQGLRIKEIREKFHQIVSDVEVDRMGLLRLFIQTAPKIFNFNQDADVYLTGTHNFLRQPDFSDQQKVSGVVEVLEDRKVIVHLLDKSTERSPVEIKIGEEIGEKRMINCSIIAARYQIGDVVGSLGIIGPMRMDYSHLIPLVDFTAHMLSKTYQE
ncbi:MAG: heat-inducible transcriptional repressor HrcA [Calditrichia bacterium]